MTLRRAHHAADDRGERLRRASCSACCTGRRRPIARSKTRVAGIVADVRARGDAAVLEYTARFDGVQAASVAELEIGATNCAPRSTACRPRSATRCRPRPRACAATTSTSCDACCQSWQIRDADGTLLGQKVTPLDRVGIYVPGGKAAYPSSVLMNAIPAQVAGVGEIVMVVPTPQGAAQSAGAGRGPGGRRAPGVHDRRRAGGRRAGLRHGHGAARRQDHRPGQRLRRQRQAPRVRPGRHRHDRRPERDPRAGRRQHRPRLGGDGPVQPGRARRAGAEHPAVARRGVPRRGGARRSSGCCRACRAAT